MANKNVYIRECLNRLLGCRENDKLIMRILPMNVNHFICHNNASFTPDLKLSLIFSDSD